MASLISIFATAFASCLLVGKASALFENMSTITKQNHVPFKGESLIKSVGIADGGQVLQSVHTLMVYVNRLVNLPQLRLKLSETAAKHTWVKPVPSLEAEPSTKS